MGFWNWYWSSTAIDQGAFALSGFGHVTVFGFTADSDPAFVWLVR